jgi:outer membrane receptor protein involved in Fe transport
VTIRIPDSVSWAVRATAAVALGLALVVPVSFSAEAEEEDEELAAVQVTGTRIQNPNVTSANPITSVNAEDMRRLGIVNVSDALVQMVPQNISTYTPTMTGDNQAGAGGGGLDTIDRGSFFIGSTIANLRGLDPAFGSRTLTLIDGRRTVSSSNQADVVDLNTIPSNLLERMDVVTGGASATYGSGAMAGVVNLVLARRLTGINLDLDYGVNEAGDGASPHVSLSGGTPLFGGKGHILLGLEWQKQDAIRDCASARDWCAESRALFSNNSVASPLNTDPVNSLPGYEGFPARFEVENLRFSQFAPTGTIYYNNSNVLTDYRFTADGTGVEEYTLGYRGGVGTLASANNAINGDGPLVTSNTVLVPSNERKNAFTSFEYDLTSSTTAYVQARYSVTDALNRNRFTQGSYCARFDLNQGGLVGWNAPAGTVWTFGTTSAGTVGGVPYSKTRSVQLNQIITDTTATSASIDPSLVAFLGLTGTNSQIISYNTGGLNPYTTTRTPGLAWPFWVPVQLSPNGPPSFNFNGNAVGTWVRFSFDVYNTNPAAKLATPGATNFATGPTGQVWANDFWLLDTLTLTSDYTTGIDESLPQLGRNAYAFLYNLNPEALYRVQKAFGNAPTAGSEAGVGNILGGSPCGGRNNLFTAVRKVWNPQIQQFTSQKSETIGVTAGMRGRFGGDWRWDTYYQYGTTESTSKSTDVNTNIRLAFAADAVIDDRPTINGQPNPTYLTPICRVQRDGTPVLDSLGRPLSNPDGLVALAAACKPINFIGTQFAQSQNITGYTGLQGTYNAAELQQQAIDYAFVDTRSSGDTSLQTLSVTTNGTVWNGWAGPLSGAFGLEVRENKVSQDPTAGDLWLRADLSRTWADAFGGRTRVYEGYTEFNMPLVAGQDGINLLNINAAVRYGIYDNKGGAGTTGESATQRTPNWKFATEFSPFDWVRFRLTRSADLRAADYRDLFIYQPGIADDTAVRNPWRERAATTTENQNERYTQIRVGNAELKPEKSNTLTLGLVLSPGGWAQGMRFTADYYHIRVKDGITVPFTATSPVRACFEQSGNEEPRYSNGELENPDTARRDLFDETLDPCKELEFALQTDAQGNPIPGTRNLEDLVAYNASRPKNALPYERRGIDFAWNYNFPLNRAFESLPGSMSLRITGTRSLESSGIREQTIATGFTGTNPDACGAKYDIVELTAAGLPIVYNRHTCVDLVGQIRSSVFIPGVTASPKWSGNVSGSYLLGNLTATLSARYIGGARFDNTWVDDPANPLYYAANGSGRLSAVSVDDNRVDPYLNFSLNGSYDLKVPNMKQFQVFGSINNLFDKSPPFTGGGISGASPGFNDTLGRAYRMGVRLKF